MVWWGAPSILHHACTIVSGSTSQLMFLGSTSPLIDVLGLHVSSMHVILRKSHSFGRLHQLKSLMIEWWLQNFMGIIYTGQDEMGQKVAYMEEIYFCVRWASGWRLSPPINSSWCYMHNLHVLMYVLQTNTIYICTHFSSIIVLESIHASIMTEKW